MRGIFSRTNANKLEDIDNGAAAFHHPNFHFTETVEQSKAIGRYNGGIIILAGPVSGGVFLTHGEEKSLSGLKKDLLEIGLPETVLMTPQLDEEFFLRENTPELISGNVPRRLLPDAVGQPDWHNELVQFSLDLREQLEQAADERSKKAILRRIKRALATKD